ncbi:MFS general substrate transporter [Clavulina sp. PMI_390]|nr:MFS general substrate transporter [Clavulina sp. PMI_390]
MSAINEPAMAQNPVVDLEGQTADITTAKDEDISDASVSVHTKLGSGAPSPKAAEKQLPITNLDGERDPAFLVTWDGPDDPENPMNWSRVSRWYHVWLGTILSILTSIASSSPTGIAPNMEKTFGFSSEVATVLISVYLIGFTFGPMFWSPASEVYGRRWISIITVILFSIFQVACALAKNTASIIIFRLISGAIGIAPLANAPAIVSDVTQAHERATGMSIFMLSPLVGPSIGPVISGFIHNSGTDWRWVFWVLSMAGAFLSVVTIFTFHETYAPTVLVHKAARKRKETGDDRWYAALEAKHVPLAQTAQAIFVKPWEILVREPILIAIHTYIAFQYALLYLNFQSYPVVFIFEKHYSIGVGSLTFLGILVGGVIAIGAVIFVFGPKYMKLVKSYAPNPAPPESRLGLTKIGSVLFTVSLFIFAWTSYPGLSWVGPTVAGGVFAFSIACTFISLTAYIVDVYLQVTASALATQVVTRSLAAAGLPLVARQMYETLTPRWASSLLGFVSLVLLPTPWLLERYGPYLRSKSRYVPNKRV